MDNNAKQFTCECGKQFSNRNELDQHRRNCATAQAGSSSKQGTSGQKVHSASGSHRTNE